MINIQCNIKHTIFWNIPSPLYVLFTEKPTVSRKYLDYSFFLGFVNCKYKVDDILNKTKHKSYSLQIKHILTTRLPWVTNLPRRVEVFKTTRRIKLADQWPSITITLWLLSCPPCGIYFVINTYKIKDVI